MKKRLVGRMPKDLIIGRCIGCLLLMLKNNEKVHTLWTAPALQTAKETPKMALAPNFAEI
uniref:Uncharacterized protein n=1 Tax=Romanomermis culicivorax TaxID=13658 RepID=A0A915K5S8_ROMCU